MREKEAGKVDVVIYPDEGEIICDFSNELIETPYVNILTKRGYESVISDKICNYIVERQKVTIELDDDLLNHDQVVS